jgi:hypothetical protein
MGKSRTAVKAALTKERRGEGDTGRRRSCVEAVTMEKKFCRDASLMLRLFLSGLPTQTESGTSTLRRRFEEIKT